MAVEIHEDQPLAGMGAVWPRELWVPAIHLSNAYGGNQYPANILSGQSASMIVKLPTDFTSILIATLSLYGGATMNFSLTIRGWAGACTEAPAIHNQTDTRLHALTLNVFSCTDLALILPAFFAALTAGDHVYILVTNNTLGNVTVYGLDLRYT